MTQKQKIAIIDDNGSFRESLKQFIGKSADYEIIGEAADARQGEQVIRDIQVDLAIVDLSLPDRSGIQLTRTIKTLKPKIPIVIVSMHSKIDYILAALRAGAIGYLMKESVARCLLNALESASRNEYYLDSSLSQEISTRLLDMSAPVTVDDATYEKLTAREQEILRFLSQGISVSAIADKLYISAKTVANHRTNIMNKLELHCTADIVRYAAKLGILEHSCN